jgi:RNase P subunit RPR2
MCGVVRGTSGFGNNTSDGQPIEIDSNGTKRYFCDNCGKGFSSVNKSAFDEHVRKGVCSLRRIGWNQEPVKCSACELTFSGQLYYAQHYRLVHAGLPPELQHIEQFMCDQCPNVYLSKLSLKLHVTSKHEQVGLEKTTVSVRQCPHCEKSFRTLTGFREHLKSKHENSRPFKCQSCHRCFGTSTRLRTHNASMHQRVKCEECGQEICNKFILLRHKASVHGMKPPNAYQCEFCPAFYTHKIALEKHTTKQH